MIAKIAWNSYFAIFFVTIVQQNNLRTWYYTNWFQTKIERNRIYSKPRPIFLRELNLRYQMFYLSQLPKKICNQYKFDISFGEIDLQKVI